MSTNFFERQDTAHRHTGRLVLLFCLAVIAIVGGSSLVTYLAVDYVESQNVAHGYHNVSGLNKTAAALYVGIGSAVLIVLGTLFKIAQLTGGGSVIAEQLGGRLLHHNTSKGSEQQLLNVVEEMALASGVPVPPVYLLEGEDSINAFAAGYSPSDAVIGVTRGSVEKLSREQLQGVIAHEFSHILNGDMRLNIRLIGVLHGILLLGLMGEFLLRTAAFSGSGRDKKDGGLGLVVVLVALAIFILGYVGMFMGSLIKAAVSRQREFLADASAVQFTRNPNGLAGALKRIGAKLQGSSIKHHHASQASHMFFAQGVNLYFASLATHPPLKQRIEAIDPAWDGQFPTITSKTTGPTSAPAKKQTSTAAAVPTAAMAAAGVAAMSLSGQQQSQTPGPAVADLAQASGQIGNPTVDHQRYAAQLIGSLPDELTTAAHEAYGARAVIYGLLLDKDPEIRDRQLQTLDQQASPDVVKLTHQLIGAIDALDAHTRLPLVDMTLPALRSMSTDQYRTFVTCFQALAAADEQLGFFEWILHHILLRHLKPQFERVRPARVVYYGLQRLGEPCSVLFSSLARVGHTDAQAAVAFAAAKEVLDDVPLQLLDSNDCNLAHLQNALEQLAQVAIKQKERLINGAAACIAADQEVSVREAELLRAISDTLDCHMPPLLPGQLIAPVTTADSAPPDKTS
ncbi:MAG: M48 family metallopeptidase [Pirellulales bacterium]|nr:M48 family metallopeptidase [Pirellulales bacterium]